MSCDSGVKENAPKIEAKTAEATTEVTQEPAITLYGKEN